MRLKETLFNEYMIRDVLYLSIRASIVFLLMWWYTASLILTFMSVTSIALSSAEDDPAPNKDGTKTGRQRGHRLFTMS